MSLLETVSQSAFRPTALAIAVLGLSSLNTAHATPTVTGMTISLPDDGWYQVQQADTFATICQGELSCVVEAGQYIVINHTTGVRYENIQVGADQLPETTSSSVEVNGQTISWPDNGWYQVQDEANYSTMCEGGLSCTVEAGSYIVINHTTGARYANITVGDGNDDTAPNNEGPVVSGSTISWSDDGWYQVQNADTYATVCEGGLNCTADAGEYIVINLTTGTRYNNIVVAGTTTETDDSFALDLVAQDLLYSLAGFSLVESFSQIEELATRQAATSTGQILTQGQFSTEDARYDTVETAVNRVLYNCSGGGTMTLESGEMSINESSYSHFRNVDSYVFDQCLIELEDDATEFYTLSGTASKDIRSRSGSRFTEGDTNHQWLDFLLLGPNDTRTEITANVGTVRSSTTSGNSSSRTATIDYYGQSEGLFAEIIQNANFDKSESSNEYVTVQNKSIDVNGYVLGEATAYNHVEITTNPTLSRRRAVGPSASSNLPFTGQIEFQVTDSSFLYLTANPVEDETDPQNTLLVDLSYTTTTGDTTTTTMVPLIDFN